MQLEKRSIRAAVLLMAAAPLAAAELSPEDNEYFESQVRPLLVENCYKCHATDSKKIRGGFLLDSAPALLRGGDSGPAIVRGQASQSRLIQMIERHPDVEAMPPKSKLSREEIDTLIAWIDRGAPDPRPETAHARADSSDFDLEARKQWWSLQPIRKPAPPSIQYADWPANDYDRFLLAKLEEKGWAPAPPAEPSALLRRLSFDLIGLAPPPEELKTFLADTAPQAYAKQVDRLLASPRFGEKWARHWMDLVRYAETKAFEADYTMPHVYRYRDYLIQAFNQDLPFDQFILESLAGDLLETPRLHPETGDNESAKGPGYIYLTDGQHAPPDIHEDEARVFDSMIDVTSKAFLGTTLACARCHDHKFDAVTTADYYSFYGVLRSSRLAYANTVSEDAQAKVLSKLEPQNRALQPLLYRQLENAIPQVATYLDAAREVLETTELKTTVEEVRSDYPKKLNPKMLQEYLDTLDRKIKTASKQYAAQRAIDPNILRHALSLALLPKTQEQWPELRPLFSDTGPTNNPPKETSETFAALLQNPAQWKRQGLAFDSPPAKVGSLVVSGAGPLALNGVLSESFASAHLAARVTGSLRSPDFIIDGKPILLRAKGRFGSVRLVVRNYELTGRGPTTSKLHAAVDGDHWETIRINTDLWIGQPAYLETNHNGQAIQILSPGEKAPSYDENAYIAIRFDTVPDWNAYWKSETRSVTALLETLVANGKRGQISSQDADLLNAFIGSGLLNLKLSDNQDLDTKLSKYRSIAQSVPQPRFTRSLVDGDSHDQPVFVRGSHKNPSSKPNPRHFLDGLGGQPLETAGSGRLEWANKVASPKNPLTSRVIANRIWQQLFGEGIVATASDFGKMGAAPTHPELLDRLAGDLIESGWSLKSLIRELALSSAYRMSSVPSAAALETDPKNRLLQRMPVKRLEAEQIRDHILACSDQLDTTMFGPSVEAYVEDHPDSRAKPATGPIDGNGRRSVYLELRRSYLPTFLSAFDMPNATESIGERHATNVPAQSLALMNDPFVHQQAKAWAEHALSQSANFKERIDQLHLAAFSRPATESEIDLSRRFVQSFSSEYGTSPDDPAVWTDLCHLIYNRKEFIYLF